MSRELRITPEELALSIAFDALRQRFDDAGMPDVANAVGELGNGIIEDRRKLVERIEVAERGCRSLSRQLEESRQLEKAAPEGEVMW